MRLALVAFLFLVSEPPAFDLPSFHAHAAGFHHTILMLPTCVGHIGVHGSFMMDTPQQEGLPFSVSTIVTPGLIASNITTAGYAGLDDHAAAEVGNVFNNIAEVIVRKIIDDCKSIEL
jgi:hypothetical protein